jgi:methylmalonyl-CoA/ethylmalonyl-CoA epimerase
MTRLLKINHIGVAVSDIDTALSFWRDALGLKVDHIENVDRQKSRVAFLPVGEGEIELVMPTAEDSTMMKYLTERGPGIHHLCIEVDHIDLALKELKVKGVRLINEEPIEEEGRKMAFVHPKSTGGVLLELYEVTGK